MKVNLYVYANDDPVNLVDLSGRTPNPAVVTAGFLAVIAGVCVLLAIESVASIIGVSASSFFGICAAVAGLGAAYEGLVALTSG